MKNTELCLLATKGNMFKKRKIKNIFQLVEAERTNHSKKPDIIRQKIQQLFGECNRLELFARSTFPGWSVWGNEVKSDIVL